MTRATFARVGCLTWAPATANILACRRPRIGHGILDLARIVLKPTKWWALIFLPILLRALIPVGFMPMFGPGFSVRMVVCDGYAPVPWTTAASAPADMPMDMSMDMPMDAPPAHHSEAGGNCSYGCAPALGALPTPASLPLRLGLQSLAAVEARAQIVYFEVSPRAQSPRGPPA